MRPQYAAAGAPVGFVNIPLILMSLVAILVPIALVIWIVRYLMAMSEERRRLRLEVSKLAHELEGLRTDRGDKAKEDREPTA